MSNYSGAEKKNNKDFHTNQTTKFDTFSIKISFLKYWLKVWEIQTTIKYHENLCRQNIIYLSRYISF